MQHSEWMQSTWKNIYSARQLEWMGGKDMSEYRKSNCSEMQEWMQTVTLQWISTLKRACFYKLVYSDIDMAKEEIWI